MNTADEIAAMLGARSFCVVGASRDPEKYGNAVYRSIKSSGKKAYPINPNAASIGTSTCYPSLEALPETVEVAVLVVPPDIVEQVVHVAHGLGIKNIWMQPGAISQAAIDYCEEHGMAVVAGECLMTHLWKDIADEDM